MSASSSSGDREDRIPDLVFPVCHPLPAHETADPGIAAGEIIELSEAYLPTATRRADFEARRLAMKTETPFRLQEEDT